MKTWTRKLKWHLRLKQTDNVWVQIQDSSQLVQRNVSADLTAQVIVKSNDETNYICFLSTGSSRPCWPTRIRGTQRWEGRVFLIVLTHITMIPGYEKFCCREVLVPRIHFALKPTASYFHGYLIFSSSLWKRVFCLNCLCKLKNPGFIGHTCSLHGCRMY